MDLPAEARRDMGYQLSRVQLGMEPSDWKPMTTVGKGVREIRVSADRRTFRSIYVVMTADAVHVLHVFEKKTQKTPKRDVEIARMRFKAMG